MLGAMFDSCLHLGRLVPGLFNIPRDKAIALQLRVPPKYLVFRANTADKDTMLFLTIISLVLTVLTVICIIQCFWETCPKSCYYLIRLTSSI